MSEQMKSIILDEVVKDPTGNVIASKEIINEINFKGDTCECITREVIKSETGKVLINNILYQSIINAQDKCLTVNFLAGAIEDGGGNG